MASIWFRRRRTPPMATLLPPEPRLMPMTKIERFLESGDYGLIEVADTPRILAALHLRLKALEER